MDAAEETSRGAPTRIEPDLEFIRELSRQSGGSFKKCFQCGTCSATCDVSPDTEPFPRKEMAWSIWGMKDRLLKDPDVWLCYGCTDCSIHCPRGARPGDVLAAVRKEVIREFSPLGFVQTALSSPKWLPVLIALPIVIWGAVYLLFANPAVPSSPRRRMTLKASPDLGATWPEASQLLLDEGESAGYPALSMIDEETVGVLFEGSRAHLTFMRVPLGEVVR